MRLISDGDGAYDNADVNEKVVAFALDQSAHYPFMLGATNIQRQVNNDHLDY